MVLDLGCGLDPRPARCNLPTSADWYDIDFAVVAEALTATHLVAYRQFAFNAYTAIDLWAASLFVARGEFFVIQLSGAGIHEPHEPARWEPA